MQHRSMQITYASTFKSRDIRKWSGLVHFIADALEKQSIDLHRIEALAHIHKLANVALSKSYRHVYNAPFPVERTLAYSKKCARALERAHSQKSSALFAPSTIPLAKYKGPLPSIAYTDATFQIVLDQYPEMKRYPKRFLSEGMRIEQLAMEQADALVFSSQWAATSAINDHGADKSKVHVVPFGSNLSIPLPLATVFQAIHERSQTTCELLFLAVRWKSKGGDTLMRVIDELKRKGIPVRLTIVGCVPEGKSLPDHVRCEGFIDKNNQEGQRRIIEYMLRSHFMILPTHVDCTPVVFSECNFAGLPCLSTGNIGGISEIIRDNVNGHTFEQEDAKAYAHFIAEKWSNASAYTSLAKRSRLYYDKHLNWASSGRELKRIIQSTIAHSS